MSEPSSSLFKLHPLLAGPLLVLLIIGIYWPGLGGGFAFDDFPNIVSNSRLHVTEGRWQAWYAAALSSPASDLPRPLAMLSFALNHYFSGLDPWPMKLTNVLIHAVNGLLVVGLLLRVLAAASSVTSVRVPPWLAWFAGALWSLHPINLTSVLFVVQRMESLSHLFVFAGLWMFAAGRLRQIEGRGGWLLLLTGLVPCTVLGIMVKESAALLPMYAFGLELFLFRFKTTSVAVDRRLVAMYVFVLFIPVIVAVAWLLPKALMPGSYASRDFTLVERLLTEPRVLIDYLRWTVLPDLNQLSLYHDDYQHSRGLWRPVSTGLSIIALAVLAITAFLIRNFRPLIGLGIFWFLSAHLLTATFIPLELVFEHRNYFASLGICLIAAMLLNIASERQSRQALARLVAVTLLVCIGVATFARANEWDDPVGFSFSEASKHPRSPRATYARAVTLVEMTGYDAKSPVTTAAWTALNQAREAPGSGILPHQAALVFAARSGTPLPSGWRSALLEKLKHEPIGSEEIGAIGSLTQCAVRSQCHFPPSEMLEMYSAALSREPHAEILHMFGDYVLNVVRDPELTLRLWMEAVERQPGHGQYRISLARLLIALGRFDEARLQIARLRRTGFVGEFDGSADELEKALLPTLAPTGSPGLR